MVATEAAKATAQVRWTEVPAAVVAEAAVLPGWMEAVAALLIMEMIPVFRPVKEVPAAAGVVQ